MKKQIYNLLFEINNDILTLTDVKTGLIRNWKIKSCDCESVYNIQKKQIKTIYEDMNDLLNSLTQLYFNWPSKVGFTVDYKFNTKV